MDPPLDMVRNGFEVTVGMSDVCYATAGEWERMVVGLRVVAGSQERREEVVERPNPQTFMSSLGCGQHAQGAPPHWARLGPHILIV